MNFDQEIGFIKDALSRPLPGADAQHLMAPRQRKTTQELLLTQTHYRLSGVMMLLYPDETGTLHTIFIERPHNTSVHSGQVAFPGGKVEPDDATPGDAATRETEEEIGIPAHEIEILGRLSTLFIPASNFLVHPFVGMIPNVPAFHPNPEEVQSLIPVPLREVLELQSFLKEFKTSFGLLPAPCFNLKGYFMWGATAMIVSEFREMMRGHK